MFNFRVKFLLRMLSWTAEMKRVGDSETAEATRHRTIEDRESEG
jgi:hypothetical protein